MVDRMRECRAGSSPPDLLLEVSRCPAKYSARNGVHSIHGYREDLAAVTREEVAQEYYECRLTLHRK